MALVDKDLIGCLCRGNGIEDPKTIKFIIRTLDETGGTPKTEKLNKILEIFAGAENRLKHLRGTTYGQMWG